MNVMIGKYLTESGRPQPVGIQVKGGKSIGNLSSKSFITLIVNLRIMCIVIVETVRVQ